MLITPFRPSDYNKEYKANKNTGDICDTELDGDRKYNKDDICPYDKYDKCEGM